MSWVISIVRYLSFSLEKGWRTAVKDDLKNTLNLLYDQSFSQEVGFIYMEIATFMSQYLEIVIEFSSAFDPWFSARRIFLFVPELPESIQC
jgi:hypothetical protein